MMEMEMNADEDKVCIMYYYFLHAEESKIKYVFRSGATPSSSLYQFHNLFYLHIDYCKMCIFI